MKSYFVTQLMLYVCLFVPETEILLCYECTYKFLLFALIIDLFGTLMTC